MSSFASVKTWKPNLGYTLYLYIMKGFGENPIQGVADGLFAINHSVVANFIQVLGNTIRM